MSRKLQIKRGDKANLPDLAQGEFGLVLDTPELYIGGVNKNLQVPLLDDNGKVPSGQLPEMNYDPAGSAAGVQANLTAHENNKNNPHGVTAAQVGAATKAVYTATLSTSWSGSGPYTQTVNISGITSDMVPVVDVVLSSSSSTAKNQLAAWGCVGKIVTNNGSITATCYDEKPTTSIPIQLLVVQ